MFAGLASQLGCETLHLFPWGYVTACVAAVLHRNTVREMQCEGRDLGHHRALIQGTTFPWEWGEGRQGTSHASHLAVGTQFKNSRVLFFSSKLTQEFLKTFSSM